MGGDWTREVGVCGQVMKRDINTKIIFPTINFNVSIMKRIIAKGGKGLGSPFDAIFASCLTVY